MVYSLVMHKEMPMQSNTRKETNEEKREVACFPSWFLTMTDSPPLLVAFAITVVLLAPLLMLFGALYPLFKH